jgi:PST family polysaccharide transporter
MDHSFIKYLPGFIRTRIEGRHILQKTISNTGWLFADKIIRMGVGLFVGIWIARYLGPEQFGILSYAVAFVALFSVIATLGIDQIVVRNIVRDPSSKEEILGTAFVMKFFGGVITLLMTLCTILFLRPMDTLVHWMVGIIAAGTIFQSLDTIELWFQSQIQSKYSVYAKNVAFLIITLTKIGLIISGAPLIAFAWAAFAEIVLGSIGLIIMYRMKGYYLKNWNVNILKAKNLLRDGWSLILSGFVIIIYMKIDQVMIGEMLGEKSVGIYSVAVTLSEAWYFIPGIIVSSAFPAIIAAKKIDERLYVNRLQQLYDLLSALAFMIAVVMTFASQNVIYYLYGERFIKASIVLTIHIWSGLFFFPGNVRGHFLVIENKQYLALWYRTVGAVLNVILNLLLIPKYGVAGAAWATLISYSLPVYIVGIFNPLIRWTVLMNLKSYVLPIRVLVYRGALYR